MGKVLLLRQTTMFGKQMSLLKQLTYVCCEAQRPATVLVPQIDAVSGSSAAGHLSTNMQRGVECSVSFCQPMAHQRDQGIA